MLFLVNINLILATVENQTCYASSIFKIIENIKYLSLFNKTTLENFRSRCYDTLKSANDSHYTASLEEVSKFANEIDGFLNRIPEIIFINYIASADIFNEIKKKAEKYIKNIKNSLKQGLSFPETPEHYISNHNENIEERLKKIELILTRFLVGFSIKQHSISFKNQPPEVALLELSNDLNTLTNFQMPNDIQDTQTGQILREVSELQIFIYSNIFNLSIGNLYCTLKNSEYLIIKRNYEILRNDILNAMYSVLNAENSFDRQLLITNDSFIWLTHASLLSNINLIFILTDHIWDNIERNTPLIKESKLRVNTCKRLFDVFTDCEETLRNVNSLTVNELTNNIPNHESSTICNIIIHCEQIINMIASYKNFCRNIFTLDSEFVFFDNNDLFYFRKHLFLIINHLRITVEKFRYITNICQFAEPNSEIFRHIIVLKYQLSNVLIRISDIAEQVGFE